MEAEVLKGGRRLIERTKPILYVENDRRDRSAALIALIQSLDYQLWWHTPPLFNPNNYFGLSENDYGGIMSINMLGMPRGHKIAVQGLKEVTGPEDFPLPPR
jgi:hypothetical protein